MKMREGIKKAGPLVLGLQLAVFTAFAQGSPEVLKAINAEQYDKAKQISSGLIASKPSDAQNYYYLGELYLLSGSVDSAKTVFGKGVAANASEGLNYIGLASVDMEQKNVASAKLNIDKAISLAPKKDNTIYIEAGHAYLSATKPDYSSAQVLLNKAIALDEKDAVAYLELGNVYKGQKKYTEAYNSYNKAVELDKGLLPARIQLGVLVKRSTAYKESADEFNKLLAQDATYAPAYRELAETYYLWANAQPKLYDEKIKLALDYYKKYLDLTDKSLDSRMRYADFLILAKDYKTLEQEAQAMSKMENSNLRIYRYLGYAAFQNGNYPDAVTALNNFITRADSSRIIGSDYFFLGQSQLKAADTKGAIVNLKRAIALDPSNAEGMSDLAKTLYTAKQYEDAAQAYELAVSNPNSKTIAYDSFYLGLAYYFNYADKVKNKLEVPKETLPLADTAFSRVITLSPTSPDSYLYRARVRRLADDQENPVGLMVPDYMKYAELITTKSDYATDARLKASLIEAYSYLGAFAAKKDANVKEATEYFNKIKALDPQNEYAASSLKSLQGGR